MSLSHAQHIAILEQTHAALLRLTETLTDECLDFHSAADEWSVREILAHLVDDEMYVMRTRVTRMLKEDMPLLVPHDEKQWHATRDTTRDQLSELLSDFADQRVASLGILRMVRAADWQRQGRQPEYGVLTVEGWLKRWAEHDLTHIEQISSTIEVYNKR